MDWSFERFLVTLELMLDGFGLFVTELMGKRIGNFFDGFASIVLPDIIAQMTVLDFMLSSGITIIIGVVLFKFFRDIFVP